LLPEIYSIRLFNNDDHTSSQVSYASGGYSFNSHITIVNKNNPTNKIFETFVRWPNKKIEKFKIKFNKN